LVKLLKEQGILKPRFSLREPDYICYLGYACSLLDEVYSSFPDVERVDFVVSRKNKVTTHIQQFHDELRSVLEVRDPRLADLVGRLTPGDMAESPGLQAADLLCWHARGDMQRRFMSRNSWRLNSGARQIRTYEHGAVDLDTLERGIVDGQNHRLLSSI
jgi:hypothetical protein